MNPALAADTLAGRLVVRSGASPSLACTRPVLGASLMQRLVRGRHATLLPDLLGAVFTLCAHAHRTTARRAVHAALGLPDDAAQQRHESLRLHLATAREHLQRLAVDTPGRAPLADAGAADAGWVRDAPVTAMPEAGASMPPERLQAAGAALAGWLERRLLGRPPGGWLADWQAHPLAALDAWCATSAHPVARWLAAAQPAEAALPPLPLQPLPVPDAAGAAWLAERLGGHDGFVHAPHWQGEPAETGPWARAGEPAGRVPALGVRQRHGARVADLARIAVALSAPAAGGPPAPGWLRFGAHALGDGQGLAWTEMSRGLLVHWVRLEPGWRDAAGARLADCRVLAPTEWNFHPQGALARALARAPLHDDIVRVAVTAFDPCVTFDIARPAEAPHA